MEYTLTASQVQVCENLLYTIGTNKAEMKTASKKYTKAKEFICVDSLVYFFKSEGKTAFETKVLVDKIKNVETLLRGQN